MSYKDPPDIPLPDVSTYNFIREVRRALIELARQLRHLDITVTLKDGVPLVITHKLGRPMLSYSMTAPIGAVTSGRIVESNRVPLEGFTLTATGYGADITVSLRIW